MRNVFATVIKMQYLPISNCSAECSSRWVRKLFIFYLHVHPPPVTSSLGGGVPVWRRLLLRLLLLGQRLLQPGAFPGVVLPVQQLLLVDELGTLSVDQLLPEVFVLQQLQHVEAVRIPEEEEEEEEEDEEETGGVRSYRVWDWRRDEDHHSETIMPRCLIWFSVEESDTHNVTEA